MKKKELKLIVQQLKAANEKLDKANDKLMATVIMQMEVIDKRDATIAALKEIVREYERGERR